MIEVYLLILIGLKLWELWPTTDEDEDEGDLEVANPVGFEAYEPTLDGEAFPPETP